MRRQFRLYLLALAAMVVVSTTGCGGSSSPPPPPPPPSISVLVSAADSSVHASSIESLAATVTNDSADKGVSWTVSCSATPCGWISPSSTGSGAVTTYIAPSTPPATTPSVTVTATSVADSSKSASAAITITPAVPNFAYTANFTGSISAFTVDPSSGALLQVSGSPFATGNRPFSLAVDRLSKFLYSPSDTGANVLAFTIDALTGALAPVPGAHFTVGGYPQTVGIDPTGRFAYVANSNSDDVSAFTIDANTGVLTPIAGSPFAAALNPMSVAIDPAGRFAYVGTSLFPTITSFSINTANGMLTRVTSSGLPASLGCDNSWIVVHPTGKFLFMLCPCDGIYAFTVDPSSGTLGLVAGSPFGAISTNSLRSETLEPTGRFLYLTDSYHNNILAFAIDPSTGVPSPIAGSPFPVAVPAGGAPYAMTVDPSGKFAYVTDNSDLVLGFTIDPTTGALAPMSGSPFATATCGGLACPGGQPHTVLVAGKIG